MAEQVATRLDELNRQLLKVAAAAHPEEMVAGVFKRPGDAAGFFIENWTNISPTPRRAFAVADVTILRALRRADARWVALAHSHPDGPAGLSARDVAAWVQDGRPLFPGVATVLVVPPPHPPSVDVYLWNDALGRLVKAPSGFAVLDSPDA